MSSPTMVKLGPSLNRPWDLLNHQYTSDGTMLRRRLAQEYTSATATQAPTDSYTNSYTSRSTSSSASSSSSYSNRNSSSSRNQPLFTLGELVGAFLIATVTIFIALYFLNGNFSGRRRYRDEKGSSSRDGRNRRRAGFFPRRSHRRRPRDVAEREDNDKDNTVSKIGGSNLVGIANISVDTDGDDADSAMAIISIPNRTTGSPHFRSFPSTPNKNDDATTKATIELADASRYSLSSDDGTNVSMESPLRRSPRRGKLRGGDKTNSIATQNTETSGSQLTKENSDKFKSLTSVLLEAILPRAAYRADDDGTDMVYNLSYHRHNDDDEETNTHQTDASSTISSPFHPSHQTPPRIKRLHKAKTFFLSNDNSEICRTVGGGDGESIFDGIADDERPFDCIPESTSWESRPFDCENDGRAVTLPTLQNQRQLL